jgi:hypothetical protein
MQFDRQFRAFLRFERRWLYYEFMPPQWTNTKKQRKKQREQRLAHKNHLPFSVIFIFPPQDKQKP